ncbi:TetR/AcrR family transcriptional regulator [Sorangium sp. So ce1036]|uniref:TetR/AcrR family transcriptional regulator n=1 Tax=Sorangium sp. So ce1036 TaxID=3133328 RepID=UPI003F11FD96
MEAVLEATFQVLRKHGPGALTTTRVAEVAGVSVGSLYQYFPNKRSLVTALHLRYFERVTGRLLAAIQGAHGLPLADAIRRTIGELLSAKRDNRELALALKASMAEIGGPSSLREATKLVTGSLEALLRAADPALDRPAVAARVLASALEGVVATALEDDAAALFDPTFEDELVALALGYLAARPGTRRAGAT